MGKSTRRARGRARARQSARTGALEVFVRPQQTLAGRIVGWLIRLRAEIFVLGCLVLGWWWLSSLMPAWLLVTALCAVTALMVVVPVIRHYLTRRFWCVLTRHRVQACFEQTRTMTHDGRMPWLVWSRPTPVGERVRVWLPAGLSVNDLERVTENLAGACYAQTARIERGTRAFMASILIVRRDTLAGDDIAPEVLGHIDGYDTTPESDRDTVVPLPSRDDVLAEVTDLTPSASASEVATPIERHARADRGDAARRPRRTPESSEANSSLRGFNGMDVSDYV